MKSRLLITVLSFALTSIAAMGAPLTLEDLFREIEALKTIVQSQQAEIAELRAEMTVEKAPESETVRTLVRESLIEAETRTVLLEDIPKAGHDGKRLLKPRADKSFDLQIGGQLQVRYLYNKRNGDSIDEVESGFQIRRGKVNFKGHLLDPKLTYFVQLATGRKANDVGLQDAVIGFRPTESLLIEAGRRKLPFLRAELNSSKRFMAVERATVTEFFTLNRGEGLWFNYAPTSSWKTTVALSDGSNSGNIGGGASGSNDFDMDRTDFAVTARADWKLAGNFDQMMDFAAWKGEPPAGFIGAAIHYESGETGDNSSSNNADYFAYTLDGSIEYNGFQVFGAFMGGHVAFKDGRKDLDHFGFLIQSSYMVVPDKLEPFVRWEMTDIDGQADKISLITLGFNRYLKKHSAKFTLDVVYALGPLIPALNNKPFGADGTSGGLGLRPDEGSNDGQIALRTMFQFLF